MNNSCLRCFICEIVKIIVSTTKNCFNFIIIVQEGTVDVCICIKETRLGAFYLFSNILSLFSREHEWPEKLKNLMFIA